MCHGSNPPAGRGVGEHPFYQWAWLFEPFFLLLETDVTTAWTVISPLQDEVKLAGEASWPLVGK
jgi:hypothetical protein